MRKFATLAACAVALTASAAFAVDTEDDTNEGGSLTTSRIDIKGGVFFPPMVLAEIGDVFFIMNNEDIAHTATAIDGSWTTGDIQPGQETQIVVTAGMTRCFESTTNKEYKGAFGSAATGEAPACFELSGAGEDDGVN